jgi:hypothetical protein
MMQNSVNDYTVYFGNLAKRHHLLLHNGNQSGSNATVKAKSKFVLFDNDEVVTGLRSLIGSGIILFLEIFTFRGSDNMAGDYRSKHQGRFIIARKVLPMNNADLISAYAECEAIVWDFINKIIHDSNLSGDACNTPFKNISLNDFSCEPVSNLWDGRAGWVVDFTYQQNRMDEIDEELANDEAIWTVV